MRRGTQKAVSHPHRTISFIADIYPVVLLGLIAVVLIIELYSALP